jgi:DNA-binding GntR family transcriptional regulator
MLRAGVSAEHIRADSVVDLAYRRIRALVLEGEIVPGSRLGQAELAERLGISRTPVREALRRLTGEGLAEFVPNRGFRAAELGLDGVRRRLEVRLLLEPGIARLAAERRNDEDLVALHDAVAREEQAQTRAAAHDASRGFHLALARATRNSELVAVFEALWIVEIGRRLLAARAAEGDWPRTDACEHRAVAEAVADRDGDRAASLMLAHVSDALRHWGHDDAPSDRDDVEPTLDRGLA